MAAPPDGNPAEFTVGSVDEITEFRSATQNVVTRHARVLRVSPWALAGWLLLGSSEGPFWGILGAVLETLPGTK